MMADGIPVRVIISVVFVAAAYAVERTLARARARRSQQLRAEKSAYQARLDEALRVVAEENASSARQRPEQTGTARCGYHSLSSLERQARKNWAKARLMKHPKIPSWTRDKAYLSLVLDAARGGCSEAMNKLADYAFRRRDYVEAYYWDLKLELAGFRVTGTQPRDILQRWLKHGTKNDFCDFHSGFHDEQYLFARSILRIRSGIDREKGLHRLRKLVEAENRDAVLYAEKNDPAGSTGDPSDGGEKLG